METKCRYCGSKGKFVKFDIQGDRITSHIICGDCSKEKNKKREEAYETGEEREKMTEQERVNKLIESEVIDLLKIKNRLQAQEADPALKKAIERIEEAIESLNSYICYNSSREEILCKVI